MVNRPYLAMTAAEMAPTAPIHIPVAWMACHFSPYGTGLTNCPSSLPEGSILILNDRTPVSGHDPRRIAGQLEEICAAFRCSKILLDFQRSGCPDTTRVVQEVSALPVPVGTTPEYAQDTNSAVFLPPLPLTASLSGHLAPWQGREVWLEIAPQSGRFYITQAGSRFSSGESKTEPLPFVDQKLHCAYEIEIQPNCVRFLLQRRKEQLEALMQEATQFGISCFIGLYQDLGAFFAQKEAHATALDQP